ncbi:ABC transporter ATP-binding protein [Desulfoluna spongiiphila]|uniref:Peptide/nickel transport system ATP-binding protein n=1 Tax=Desulfoluna spongiiphila TaxID=419481 RepID=A0A1G5GS40_9BACT|nr:ABC transporter ATP-binding protein [Desulfoluna spongiiphila]SCY54392.1 peptide/nickel transport system ATP-binding protein [Desulfoluna spongiiphila]
MSDTPLLSIRDLSVRYSTDNGAVKAISDFHLAIDKGETLGLVGETGAGKTTMALSVMQLIADPPGRITGGEILFEGQDLTKTSEADMRKIRGGKIAMIFQDPMTSLNPILPVDEQVAEMIALHNKVSKEEALKRALAMLETVGIQPDRAGEYPHQFSGGMKQRVIIAIALACNPALLIADEPTTALDVTIQAQVLELMKALKKKFDTAMIMITHDLGIVAETCDRVAIMYAGRIVEEATTELLYANPKHPYTKGLFASIPNVEEERESLAVIPGLPPDPTDMPKGCPFHPRCDKAMARCSTEIPQPVVREDGHMVACFLEGGDA